MEAEFLNFFVSKFSQLYVVARVLVLRVPAWIADLLSKLKRRGRFYSHFDATEVFVDGRNI